MDAFSPGTAGQCMTDGLVLYIAAGVLHECNRIAEVPKIVVLEDRRERLGELAIRYQAIISKRSKQSSRKNTTGRWSRSQASEAAPTHV